MNERSVDALARVWSNPFEGDLARANSSYHGWDGGELVRLPEAAPPDPFARIINEAFRTFVLDDAFSCLGAKAAMRRGTYRFGAYAQLADPAATAGLARDLYTFVRERGEFETDYASFVAIFREAVAADEARFEAALWAQLQRLHDLDSPLHPWDERVSDDPADPAFSFSFAGTAFFVIGLHPRASRRSRRFAWPALVFNAHEQFEHLRAEGRFAGLQRRIRERERELDGSLNPNLAEYGRRSEARQYAGRAVGETWACPFRSRR
jgi:FPC/CPF motif-containing protein YcgG